MANSNNSDDDFWNSRVVFPCQGCSKNRKQIYTSNLVNNKCSDNSTFPSKKFYLVRKVNLFSLIKYSNLIAFVIIFVLSSSVNTVNSKPVKEVGPVSRLPSGKARLLQTRSSIVPSVTGQDRLKGTTASRRRIARKMDPVKTLHKEVKDILNVAISDGNHHIEEYARNVWQDTAEDLHRAWEWKQFDWLKGDNANVDVDNLSQEEYLRELIKLYERFFKLSVGVNLIRKHFTHEQAISGIEESKLKAEDAVNSIYKQIQAVLSNLNDFYTAINLNNQRNKVDEADATAAEDDIIPEENRSYEFLDRSIQHWVILREYKEHLQFAKELIEKLRLEQQNQ